VLPPVSFYRYTHNTYRYKAQKSRQYKTPKGDTGRR